MYILKRSAVDFLNKYFHLPTTGLEQDWDIELADHKRLDEFLGACDFEFSDDMKFALMALIFASYDDYIREIGRDHEIEKRIKAKLEGDGALFMELIKYWALSDEKDSENLFCLTDFIREVLSKTK